MSTYSEYLKEVKGNNIKRFFGEVTKKSNKYFTFNHYINEDEAIIITNNVKKVKGNYVLVVANNKCVYLKDWLVKPVHNYFNGIYAYAVKINRQYFKPYTFKSDFEDICIEEEYTFDDLLNVAKEQDAKNMKIALD